MSSSSRTKFFLETSDGQFFNIEKAVNQQSIIKRMIECSFEKPCLPIPDVPLNILSKSFDSFSDQTTAAAMSPSSRIKLVLETSDGEFIEMEEAVYEQSIIKRMVACGFEKTCIPIPGVTANVLYKVFEYCRMHYNKPYDDEDLKPYDAEFMKVDEETLIQLSAAARFLDIKSLSVLIWDTNVRRNRKTLAQLHRRVAYTRPSNCFR